MRETFLTKHDRETARRPTWYFRVDLTHWKADFRPTGFSIFKQRTQNKSQRGGRRGRRGGSEARHKTMFSAAALSHLSSSPSMKTWQRHRAKHRHGSPKFRHNTRHISATWRGRHRTRCRRHPRFRPKHHSFCTRQKKTSSLPVSRWRRTTTAEGILSV